MKGNIVQRLPLVLLIAGFALAAAGGPSARAVGRSATTVTIQLPPDGMSFKDGPNLATVQANCQTCHSPEYVYHQPPLSKAQWVAEVTKMQKVYKAPVPDDAIDPIASYLVTQNGKP